ncbi:hypothetical protein GCM10009416_40430 [Craurococcus roseus]|uniref:SH3 domain-containing protein n=1 Tax=Craurococcus roseus TaxID=77585 RepID=A0ABN1FUL5_9PROT
MSAPVTRFRTLAVVAGLAALQAACAQPQVAAPGPRIYAVDVQGRSALCDAPQQGVTLAAGRQTEAALTMGNDGGWCGIRTDRAGPGLVTAKPAHGRLHVRKVGATTRVDYIPDRGFAGTDTFAVKLLPDQAELRVTANVQASSTQQTASTAAVAAPEPAPTPPPAKRAAAAPPARKAAPTKR